MSSRLPSSYPREEEDDSRGPQDVDLGSTPPERPPVPFRPCHFATYADGDTAPDTEAQSQLQNVWQWMPKSHLQAMGVVVGLYVGFIFVVSAVAAAAVTNHSPALRSDCEPSIKTFLQCFAAVGFITVVAMPVGGFYFFQRALPLLRAGRDMVQNAIVANSIVGMLVVCNYGVSFYGIYAARSEDTVQQHRCGPPFDTTRGVSIAYLLVTSGVTVLYMAHYQYCLRQLHRVWRGTTSFPV